MKEQTTMVLKKIAALDEVSGHVRYVRAGVCSVIGTMLMVSGMRRKGVVGGVLTAMGGASLYRALADGLGGGERLEGRSTFGTATAVIERSLSDVYRFCRDLDNLRSVIPQVIVWAGAAEERSILEDVENELLAWRVIQGPIEYLGRMEFRPADYGGATTVEFALGRLPPETAAGASLKQQVQEALRRLKLLLERRDTAGELSSTLPPADTRTGDDVAWAEESGEPGEVRVGPGRGEASPMAGEDVAFAPESGDRVVDVRPEQESPPEPEQIQEDAQEYRITEGSEESFPASDAPSWTPGRA